MEQVKKAFCFRNSTDLSLFEKIVLAISKFLKILGLQPQISNNFLYPLTTFSHSRSEQFVKQNTYVNTIAFCCCLLFLITIFILKSKNLRRLQNWKESHHLALTFTQ